MGEAPGHVSPKERVVPVSAGEHLDDMLRHAPDEPAVLVVKSAPRCELRRDTAAVAPPHDPANMVPNDAP